jgi:hypothetical protein
MRDSHVQTTGDNIMRNTYTITSGADTIETATNLPGAIDIARAFCKVAANAGREIIIFNTAKENVFHAVSVKHSTGKMVMMMKDKFERAQKKHAAVTARRNEYDKGLVERKEARAAKKAAIAANKETRQQVRDNNAKITELYAQIHQVHLEASKKKHAFLKAFNTVKAKEHVEVEALKAQIEALMNENKLCKNNINVAANVSQDVPGDTECVF